MSETNVTRHKNECHIAGELAKDPVTKYTPTGKAVANFTICTKHGQYSEFVRCVAWEKNAETLATLKKGDYVNVVGRLQTRSWDDKQSGQKKYITEIVAFQLVTLGEEQTPLTPDPSRNGTNVARAILRPAQGVSDADVPF